MKTVVARITRWEMKAALAGVKKWADSDTAGYMARSAGAKDCTFTTEGKYDFGSASYLLFAPGDTLAVALVMDSTLFWNFPMALCEDFNMIVNVDTEEVIGWSANWGINGPFFRPAF